MDASMTAQTATVKDCPTSGVTILTLPIDIRLAIYEQVINTYHPTAFNPNPYDDTKSIKFQGYSINLALTNKQIYTEYLSTFYNLSTFTFPNTATFYNGPVLRQIAEPTCRSNIKAISGGSAFVNAFFPTIILEGCRSGSKKNVVERVCEYFTGLRFLNLNLRSNDLHDDEYATLARYSHFFSPPPKAECQLNIEIVLQVRGPIVGFIESARNGKYAQTLTSGFSVPAYGTMFMIEGRIAIRGMDVERKLALLGQKQNIVNQDVDRVLSRLGLVEEFVEDRTSGAR